MADTWLTIEQAAVTLGLSVRTVNRHINAGKIQSRLQDGRREVLVRIPDDAGEVEADEETAATAARSGASASRSATAGAQQTGRFDEATDASDYRDGNGYGQSSRRGASAVPHERDTVSAAGGYDTSGHQMETMLALADNAADKAEMAVMAYQTLARTAEHQTQSLRRYATAAWCVVAGLIVVTIVAVGWTTHHLTRANVENSSFKREAELAALAANRAAAERDKVREELSDAKQQAARIEGKVTAREDLDAAIVRAAQTVASQVPAVRPGNNPPSDGNSKIESSEHPERQTPSPTTAPAAPAPTTAPVASPVPSVPASPRAASPAPRDQGVPGSSATPGAGRPTTRPFAPRRDKPNFNTTGYGEGP
jgi:helix-turn-helix protein